MQTKAAKVKISTKQKLQNEDLYNNNPTTTYKYKKKKQKIMRTILGRSKLNEIEDKSGTNHELLQQIDDTNKED